MKISPERHKAEIRRAVNDEKLSTIAERYAPLLSEHFIFSALFMLSLLTLQVPLVYDSG